MYNAIITIYCRLLTGYDNYTVKKRLGDKMSVKERILSLKLLEMQRSQELYMNRIGITVTLVKTPDSDNDRKNNKGVKSNDKKRRN